MDKYKDLSNRDNRDYRRAKYASKLGLKDDHDASLLRKMSKKAKLPKVKILGHEIDPSKGFGGLSVALGVIGVVAAVLQMVDPASMTGAGSYFACLIFYFVLGWKAYSLSRAS